MQGGDDKSDRNGGKISEHAGEDDDTFKSLLKRVDGDFNPVRDGDKEKRRFADEEPATAPLVLRGEPQTDVHRQTGNIIALPRRAREQQLPLRIREAEGKKPQTGGRQRHWYHNNWTVIAVSMLLAVAVCSPLVLLLSYGLRWESSDTRVPDRNGILPATTDLFSRPPPGRAMHRASKAEKGATAEAGRGWSRRPVYADAAAPPELLKKPRLATEATGNGQTPVPQPTAQSENLPRIILPPQIILLSGPAGKPASLGLKFAPFALLPDGSFVLIRGLPPQIELKGGSLRGGVWVLSSGSAAAATLQASKAAAGNFEIVAALMAPGGKEINHAKATVLAVTPKEELRLGLAPPGAFQPPNRQRRASQDVQALLRRGTWLISRGDFANARALLKAAATRGSAAAAMALAETYDPNRNPKPPEFGRVADAATARKWYLKALELGGTGSLGARLKALPRN